MQRAILNLQDLKVPIYKYSSPVTGTLRLFIIYTIQVHRRKLLKICGKATERIGNVRLRRTSSLVPSRIHVFSIIFDNAPIMFYPAILIVLCVCTVLKIEFLKCISHQESRSLNRKITRVACDSVNNEIKICLHHICDGVMHSKKKGGPPIT